MDVRYRAARRSPLFQRSSLQRPFDALEWRAGPGLTLATLAAMAVLVGLGIWQLERLEWKQGLIDAREARLAATPVDLPRDAGDWQDLAFRRVEAGGVFRHDLEQYFGLTTVDGRAGHHVLTPLVRERGDAILVDRGWVPVDRVHPASRREGQPSGPVTVTGIARYRADDAPGWMTPANEPDERLWYWYDLDALEDAVGHELLPVVVEADATPNPGGLPVGGRTRVELPNDHLQYALTWFSLAGVLAVIFVLYGVRRRGADG